tara:strand:+ start:188 stop:424 length:237 start_codon:yes stop_codon:yes gene_type:complete
MAKKNEMKTVDDFVAMLAKLLNEVGPIAYAESMDLDGVNRNAMLAQLANITKANNSLTAAANGVYVGPKRNRKSKDQD